jgi:hypothetical protein
VRNSNVFFFFDVKDDIVDALISSPKLKVMGGKTVSVERADSPKSYVSA